MGIYALQLEPTQMMVVVVSGPSGFGSKVYGPLQGWGSRTNVCFGVCVRGFEVYFRGFVRRSRSSFGFAFEDYGLRQGIG